MTAKLSEEDVGDLLAILRWRAAVCDEQSLPINAARVRALAAKIQTLPAALAALEAALRPFARYAAWLDDGQPGIIPDATPIIYPEDGYPDDHSEPTVGDCRLAARILGPTATSSPTDTR